MDGHAHNAKCEVYGQVSKLAGEREKVDINGKPESSTVG
jgi:hypothetical protein